MKADFIEKEVNRILVLQGMNPRYASRYANEASLRYMQRGGNFRDILDFIGSKAQAEISGFRYKSPKK